MKIIVSSLCLASLLGVALPAPTPDGFVFPDDRRREKKLEPVITPPVLPYIEHLERDPSTLLPNETRGSKGPSVKPRFGNFGGGFNVAPTGNGGLTASVSSSASGAGASHSASQSFSFGFNEGFSASQSASQASSFSGNGFGSGFSGSQASSQAGSFGSSGSSGSASSASAFGGGFGGNSGSQSASSAFNFNSLNGFNGFNQPEATFGDGILDVRHRGVPNFPFPSLVGRSKGVGATAFRSKPRLNPRDKDFLSVFISS